MPPEPLHRLPDRIVVDLVEVRALVGRLERLQQQLAAQGDVAAVAETDELIGQVLRWLWPLLDDLRTEED